MADNKKELHCPACNAVMKKVFIDGVNTNVDICLDGCGAIWFDRAEEKFFDEAHESIDELLKIYENKEFIEVNQQYNRYCPICGTKLAKNHTSAKREVQIDECLSCGGKFFDYKELEAMRKEYDTEKERSAAALKQAYENGVVMDSMPVSGGFVGWLVHKFSH